MRRLRAFLMAAAVLAGIAIPATAVTAGAQVPRNDYFGYVMTWHGRSYCAEWHFNGRRYRYRLPIVPCDRRA